MKKLSTNTLLLLALLTNQGVLAISDTFTANEIKPATYRSAKPDQSKTASWSIAFENDILAGGSRDKDYTYGLNFTYTGERSKNWWLNPDSMRSNLDRALGVANYSPQKFSSDSFELGLYGFTPEDITESSPIADDRPYANLVYAASSHSQIDIETGRSLTSRLSIGVLGLSLAEDAQNLVHRMVDGKEAKGWHNQISDGGELTAKYSISLQQHQANAANNVELKSTWHASLGYVSELSYGLSMRAGNLQSPWWDFDPDLALYGEQSSPATDRRKIAENYFWSGFALKARAYNAFLQGQFRSNPHDYSGSDINHLLVEGWAGYTVSLHNGYSFSYVLRAHTSEIKAGTGDRTLVWGGIIFSKALT